MSALCTHRESRAQTGAISALLALPAARVLSGLKNGVTRLPLSKEFKDPFFAASAWVPIQNETIINSFDPRSEIERDTFHTFVDMNIMKNAFPLENAKKEKN